MYGTLSIAPNSHICLTPTPNPWNQPPPISDAGKSTSARSAWTATAPTAPKLFLRGEWTGPCSVASSKPKTHEHALDTPPRPNAPRRGRGTDNRCGGNADCGSLFFTGWFVVFREPRLVHQRSQLLDANPRNCLSHAPNPTTIKAISWMDRKVGFLFLAYSI